MRRWFSWLLGIAILAGVVIIVAGLHFLGVIHIPLLHREARYHADERPAGLLGAYLIGLAFAFGWTPCIGPVLGAILAMAAGEDSVRQGVGLLFVYSLGLGIPFVAAAIAIRPFMSTMQRFRSHLATVEKVLSCTSTRRPRDRAVSAVIGPIQATIPRSAARMARSDSSSQKLFTVEELVKVSTSTPRSSSASAAGSGRAGRVW